ncbi:MAG TPA: carbohydrate ABC transporter permease, partial [Acidimicrobiales bacterium]|nr:carbohydrate ABC transporter permease [Acidimicrobiales bacterium]
FVFLAAAYALARKRFFGDRALFLFVLFALAIPGVVVLLPQFQEIASLGLIDTRRGVVLLYIATNLPLAVFLMRPAFAGVPEELVESMRIDGASGFGIFRQLFLPFASSTIVAVAVFVAAMAWNELTLAVTVLHTPSLFTLPIVMALHFGSPLGTWVLMAGPLLLLVTTRRVLRRGVTAGALI